MSICELRTMVILIKGEINFFFARSHMTLSTECGLEIMYDYLGPAQGF